MKLSAILLSKYELNPGDRVRIKGERAILRVVRVMDETWIAVEGGPYTGHAITRCALEKVEG